MVILTATRITGVPKHLDVAASIAELTLQTKSVPPLLVLYAKAALAMLAVHNGDRSAAAEYCTYLVEQRGTMLWTTISVDRLLGLLSQTIGNTVQAATHFEEALTFCRKAGYRPELAWTCCDYADALLVRNGVGDQAKAALLLDESLSISTELGMRPLMERVVAHQERVETQPSRVPAFPDGLTQREVEVLELVSGGKTDREIGEELFISVNTVGNHVRSILSKTESANRTEAAIYASRHGLITKEDSTSD